MTRLAQLIACSPRSRTCSPSSTGFATVRPLLGMKDLIQSAPLCPALRLLPHASAFLAALSLSTTPEYPPPSLSACQASSSSSSSRSSA